MCSSDLQEELAWGDPGFATAAYANGLTIAPLITGGTEEQKKKYLTMLVERAVSISYSLTEPAAGSDIRSRVGHVGQERRSRWAQYP